MAGAAQMLIFFGPGPCAVARPAAPLPPGDPALPRVLERGYAAGDFGWGKDGLELVLRPV